MKQHNIPETEYATIAHFITQKFLSSEENGRFNSNIEKYIEKYEKAINILQSTKSSS